MAGWSTFTVGDSTDIMTKANIMLLCESTSKQSSSQTKSKTHPDDYERTKKTSKSLKRSHNLEKIFSI
ncbi:MAG: hypothetical protein RMY16_14755 [Nostoc sp. DedQUE12b]|uniref:hypothetical protein n=1 Tax=unclassified Nostoc TaxID=2593658 RepID=UPI002AD32882|nr:MULTISPECIES: hypothetical protein [unclassified Nostoc]MDZ7956061.1 hypothetical protein [Nostoc sp. DedQUE09]MDZ8086798.1 hypothetical protein [Nostoc sp. DedQUE12b]